MGDQQEGEEPYRDPLEGDGGLEELLSVDSVDEDARQRSDDDRGEELDGDGDPRVERRPSEVQDEPEERNVEDEIP